MIALRFLIYKICVNFPLNHFSKVGIVPKDDPKSGNPRLWLGHAENQQIAHLFLPMWLSSVQSICTENNLFSSSPCTSDTHLTHRVWKGGEGWAMGLGWDLLVSPSISAQCWTCSWARMSSSENREYSSLYSFSMLLPATETNYHKHSSFKQHRCVILYFYRSEVWFRSHQSKIKVSAGMWSFPEAPEGVSLLIWTFGKIQFFGCYRTEVPFPCCLSAESCFYFHSLACGLFLHFQSQQQPYEAVRVTCGETKGPKECQGSSGLCHQNSAWSRDLFCASGTRLGETEAH